MFQKIKKWRAPTTGAMTGTESGSPFRFSFFRSVVHHTFLSIRMKRTMVIRFSSTFSPFFYSLSLSFHNTRTQERLCAPPLSSLVIHSSHVFSVRVKRTNDDDSISPGRCATSYRREWLRWWWWHYCPTLFLFFFQNPSRSGAENCSFHYSSTADTNTFHELRRWQATIP